MLIYTFVGILSHAWARVTHESDEHWSPNDGSTVGFFFNKENSSSVFVFLSQSNVLSHSFITILPGESKVCSLL